MKDTLKPGLKMSATLPVSPDLTVPRVNPALKSFADMPPVFTTAFMVAFAETTCIDCLADHLDDGEHSVGIHVDIAHSAATPVGMTVEATVELLKVDGKNPHLPGRTRGRRRADRRRPPQARRDRSGEVHGPGGRQGRAPLVA